MKICQQCEGNRRGYIPAAIRSRVAMSRALITRRIGVHLKERESAVSFLWKKSPRDRGLGKCKQRS